MERLNQIEAFVARTVARLPTTRPSRWVVAASTAARGSVMWWILAAGLALHPATRRAAGQGAAALVATMALTHVIAKTAISRRRPDTRGMPAREALPEDPGSSAFPSAHAAAAAAFSTAVAGESPALGFAVIPLAALVAYSRVRTRVHWPTDVLGGVLLGSSTALLLRRWSTG